MNETKTYTIAELLALPCCDALNALAAELRGIRQIEGKGGIRDWIWVDTDSQFYDEFFSPATNRNQSGELLEYAQTKGLGFVVDQRSQLMPKRVTCYGSGSRWLCDIPGNNARAETVAFCAAMLAMAGRLNSENRKSY